MIDVEMSDDIRKYETKAAGPFTSRQIMCIAIGVCIALPIGLLLPFKDIGNKLLAVVVLALPAVLCGFVKMDGVYFEVIAIRLLYLYLLTPAHRKAIQKNSFHEEMNEQKKKEEQIKMLKMTGKQKKAYMETHGKNKKVTYSMRKEFKMYQ